MVVRAPERWLHNDTASELPAFSAVAAAAAAAAARLTRVLSCELREKRAVSRDSRLESCQSRVANRESGARKKGRATVFRSLSSASYNNQGLQPNQTWQPPCCWLVASDSTLALKLGLCQRQPELEPQSSGELPTKAAAAAAANSPRARPTELARF